MRHRTGLLSFVLLQFFISYCQSADTTTIAYNDFNDISLWRLNGSTTGATNANKIKVLRLTPDNTSQSGSAFISNPVKLVSDKGFMASFSAYFSFQITNTGGLNEGAGAGADGIVFIVQTVANNVGTEGGGIGYRGIKRSLGIEFDTWGNGEQTQDPDGNHVGIDTNGNTQSTVTFSEPALFNNGAVWYAWIDYDGDNQSLEVRYDTVNARPAMAKLSFKVNLPSLLVQEDAYVGFSSATGASYNTHDILSFNFVNKFQPFFYKLSLSAKPDSIVKVHDSLYLLATIHDMNNVSQPDSAKKTQWRIIESDGNPPDILKQTTGSEVLLVPTVAYTQIKIEAKIEINSQLLIDTLTIRVLPGDAYRVVIESARGSSDTSFLRHPHPLDTVMMVNLSDTASVYAVVRDQWGNYCRMADSANTVWQSITGKDIVSVMGVPRAMYHGIIRRTGPSGETLVVASEFTLINDTVCIITTGQFISSIIARDHSTGKTIDSLVMKIGQSRILDIFGLISGADPSKASSWVPVNANWYLSESIQSIKNVPVQGSVSWNYIPQTGGNGIMTIESTKFPSINKLTLPVTILADLSPYLIRAVYNPSSGTNNVGTLVLYFSEDVDLTILGKFTPDNTMHYFSSEGVASVQILGGTFFTTVSKEQFGTTITISMGAGEQFILPDRDSIQLVSGTQNRNGVSPDAKSLVKVPIEIGDGTITVAVSSNPVRVSQEIRSVLPLKTVQFYSNVIESNTIGVVVAVNSTIPLMNTNGAYGTADIYDAVGNMVASHLELKLANSGSRTDYGLFWNCTNKHNRIVGNGTYLVMIKTENVKGKSQVLKTKVGVSR